MENIYFWVYKVKMHVDLFFNQCFDFLSNKPIKARFFKDIFFLGGQFNSLVIISRTANLIFYNVIQLLNYLGQVKAKTLLISSDIC